MKHLIITLAALASLTASAQIGVDAIAKQRARDVANQNNNRVENMSGQNPAAARPAAPAVSATPMTPSQQAYATFQSQLFQVKTNAPDDVKQTLAKNMAGVAQGTKPSEATLSKLSEHLSAAWGEAKLTSANKVRVAQDIGVLLNSANRPPIQKQAMIEDVRSILQTGGASTENTAALASDLKQVTDEVTAAK